jgi:hypothetical protein
MDGPDAPGKLNYNGQVDFNACRQAVRPEREDC